MDELVGQLAVKAGIDSAVAEKTLGIMLGFLRSEGPADKVQVLIDTIPGAEAAIAASERGAGLSRLMGGGLMAVGSRLMVLGKALLVVAGVALSVLAGRQLVRHVIASPRFAVQEIRVAATTHVPADEIEALLAGRGHVGAVAVPRPRYVGARIGIHDPSGRRVGTVSHLSNTEHLFVCGPDRRRIDRALLSISRALVRHDGAGGNSPAGRAPEGRHAAVHASHL